MYRNYHLSATLPDGTYVERSVFVEDIGEGTKRLGREVLRDHFGQDGQKARVRLHKGRMVTAPRKGCLVVGRTALVAKAVTLEVAKATKAALAA